MNEFFTIAFKLLVCHLIGDYLIQTDFIAETKGSMNSLQLRPIEASKIHCAREHFKAISTDKVVFDVVDDYRALLEKVMR